MRITDTESVKMRWDTFTFPILVGTPISIDGVLANSSAAVGIVSRTIKKRPDVGDELYIMTGGSVDLSEIAYTDLSVNAMKALVGITFYKSDGHAQAQAADYSLPTASASTKGGVKVGGGLAINSAVLSVAPATEDAIGGVYKVAAFFSSGGEGEAVSAEEFNTLIYSLIDAGLMDGGGEA